MFHHIKHFFRNLVQRVRDPQGQSFVEMAIAAPILLLMFIGVFEVGWALRGYLVLANANREAARFAVKNAVLDYSTKNPAEIGYNVVLSHTTASLSEQLPLEFLNNPNATMIISHFVIDTGIPCSTGAIQNGKYVEYTCDCETGDPSDPDGDGTPWFSKDDLVLHPDSPGYSHYKQVYGQPRSTRLGGGSYQNFANQLAVENNQANCMARQSAGDSAEYVIDNVIAIEMFYDQPQLLGVPFISNRITDPIPFYTHTVMRISTSRDTESTDTIGPTCELLPITFPESSLSGNPPPQQDVELFEGGSPGNFGWTYWNSNINQTQGINYIEESLINPRLSTIDFTADEDDPDYPNDHALNVGDYVAGRTGVGNSSTIRDLLDGYVGRTVLVPVYDVVGPKPGGNASYRISHFAQVRINQICFPGDSCYGTSKAIRATFLEYQDDACEDPSEGGGGGGNNPPVAVDDTGTTPRDTPITINVVANDSDPDSDPLTVDSVTQPSKGVVVNNGDGTVTYTPKNNPSGEGTFTFEYTISDGKGGTATGTVTITVTASGGGNNPPVAQNDSGYTANAGTPLTVSAASGVLANDTDADSDPLTAVKVTDPAHGTLTLNADGSFTYTPNAGYAGNDTFTYKANDGTADSNVATVTITVNGNNAPSAVNDSYTATEDTPLTINAASGVLANDTDVEGDPLTAIKLTDPAHGTLTFNADGSFTYIPNANFSGSDSFTYKANDGFNDSAAATVSIVVNPVNDPPTAVDDSYTATQGSTLTVNAASGVLANGTDPDTIVLSAVLVSNPTKGTLTLNSDGSFTYTPTGSGSDSFTYKANDTMADSNVATVNITINPAAPVTIASHNFDDN
ncbi:MAG: tandem-95 repeat protein, partial [Chloroflexi bacterium]